MVPYHPLALIAAIVLYILVHVVAAVTAAYVAAGTTLGFIALLMLPFPKGRRIVRRHYRRFAMRARVQ